MRQARTHRNGATHSFNSNYLDSFYHSIDQDFDSREDMRNYAYEDYEAPHSDSLTENIRKLVQHFTSEQQKFIEELDFKLSMMNADLGSKLSIITDRVNEEVDCQNKLNNKLLDHEEDIQSHSRKMINMAYTINKVEDNLEWKVEALQQGITDPNDYAK